MHTASRSIGKFAMAAVAAGVLAVAIPAGTYADPPPWAPAHGKRKKGDDYTGYSGKKWQRDYGIVGGRCNREAVGAVIGAVAGGAVGSQVGRGEGRDVAIVIGAIAGAAIGAHIGRDLDQTDRACFGHALELAGDGRRITWQSADHGATYLLTPVRSFERNGVSCREFDLRITAGDRKDTRRGKACPGGDGTWRVIG